MELRFYAELNDFLPMPKRFRSFPCEAAKLTSGRCIVRHGVPLEVVDLILVDGEPVSFEHALITATRMSVYPVFETFGIDSVTKLRSSGLRILKFLLTKELAVLAQALERLGFNACCKEDLRREDLVHASLEEHRSLLTTDASLLDSPELTHAQLMRSSSLDEQLAEVLSRFHLDSPADAATHDG